MDPVFYEGLLPEPDLSTPDFVEGIPSHPGVALAARWWRLRASGIDAQGGLFLNDEFRLDRPRLARLSGEQQAEAVELLARLFLDAARLQERERCGRPVGMLRRVTANPARRRGR